MGKLLHGAHDLGDAPDTLERFIDRRGDLFEEILEITGGGGLLGASDEFRGQDVALRRAEQLLMDFQHLADILERVLEKARVVADVLDGRVDLVGNAGG